MDRSEKRLESLSKNFCLEVFLQGLTKARKLIRLFGLLDTPPIDAACLREQLSRCDPNKILVISVIWIRVIAVWVHESDTRYGTRRITLETRNRIHVIDN